MKRPGFFGFKGLLLAVVALWSSSAQAFFMYAPGILGGLAGGALGLLAGIIAGLTAPFLKRGERGSFASFVGIAGLYASVGGVIGIALEFAGLAWVVADEAQTTAAQAQAHDWNYVTATFPLRAALQKADLPTLR